MDDVKQKINNYIDLIKKHANEYLVIVLGNVKNITKNFKDYQNGTTVISEYYNLNQFNMIVNSLQKNNIETLCYFDEMDFIKDYLNGTIRNNYPKKFIVLNFAQKGTVQGRKSLIPVFCEMNDILHTNSNGFASSFAREKFFWSLCLKNNFDTPKSWLFNKNGWIIDKPTNGLKVILKLTNQASSIGLDSDTSRFCYCPEKDKDIKELASRYDEPVLVQEFISGREVETPVFFNGYECFALPPAGITIDDDDYLGEKFLDYFKRGNQGFQRFDLTKKYPKLAENVKKTSIEIAKLMDLQGICRIDYRVDDKNHYFVTDINCNPHLTETSCISKSLAYLGFNSYETTILALIGLTISRHPN